MLIFCGKNAQDMSHSCLLEVANQLRGEWVLMVDAVITHPVFVISLHLFKVKKYSQDKNKVCTCIHK